MLKSEKSPGDGRDPNEPMNLTPGMSWSGSARPLCPAQQQWRQWRRKRNPDERSVAKRK